MAKIGKVQEVAVNDLVPYERNAKIHGTGQIEKLKASIKEFGFLTPCLIDKEMNIIAGHGRVMAAKEIGMETVPCVFIEGLADVQRRAYILADNKLGELGEGDVELVASALKELSNAGFDTDLTGFLIDDQILDNEEIDELDIGVDPKDASEVKTESKFGCVYSLGRHRLMVGDLYEIEILENVLKNTNSEYLKRDCRKAIKRKRAELREYDMWQAQTKR